MLVRVLLGNSTNRIHRDVLSHDGFAHVIAEAEMSGDLSSASWKSRKAAGVVPVQSEGLRTSRANGMSSSSSLKGQEQNSDVQGQEKMDHPAQADSK